MKTLMIMKEGPDYLADSLLHGFYHLLGSDFTHSDKHDLMYKPFSNANTLQSTYGRGFTTYGTLPEYINDNTDIEKKIKSKYFDLIIYSSFRRCSDYYDLVRDVYEKDKVIFVDGEDDQLVWDSMGHRLFKRELTWNAPNVYPISFAIPSEKITDEKPLKIKKLADYIPQISGSGYMYNTEEEYYNGYKEALYGLTHKKSGWDCMRHYEILGNYSIPYFPDIDNCPQLTMTNFPKELVKRSNNLFYTECDEQYEILDNLHSYTKNHLTTEALAKYIINNT